jgi:uncharacterized phage protein (TIGR02218 family)
MIELYTITFPDSTVYRYTSTVNDIIVGGNLYTARSGLVRGEVDVSVTELDSTMTMVLPCTDAAVRKYMESPPLLPVSVEVVQAVTGGETPWFVGVVASVSVSGVTAEFRLIGDGVPALSQATALRYTAQCRHALYGVACGVDKTDHDLTGTITAIEQNGLVLTSVEWTDAPRARWIGGAIDVGGELRTIIAQPAGDKIRIDRAIIGLAVTDGYVIYEGCNKTVSICRDKFNNLANFGGIPNIPSKNPFTSNVNTSSDIE